MSADSGFSGRALLSEAGSNGRLSLHATSITLPAPVGNEIVIRVEAAPINPSDLGLILASADLATISAEGSGIDARVTGTIAPASLALLKDRLDIALPIGNEGAGIVVAAGPEAAGLIGKTVAAFAGGMYAQYRLVSAPTALVLPDGTTPAEAAAALINPLTALGMVETMRREGHTALVHTAAASNLGQMLNRICLNDGIALVNIVRSAEQAALLLSLGAVHICDSTSPSFKEDLTEALVETGATLAFDAIGGGTLAAQILQAMEAALRRTATTYNHYGTTTHKQVYLYGSLDAGPTVIDRTVGMAWGVGGWLVRPFLEKIGPDAAQRLYDRIAAELKTTFVSNYAAEISLAEALDPRNIAAYAKRATGEKFLVVPNKA